MHRCWSCASATFLRRVNCVYYAKKSGQHESAQANLTVSAAQVLGGVAKKCQCLTSCLELFKSHNALKKFKTKFTVSGHGGVGAVFLQCSITEL